MTYSTNQVRQFYVAKAVKNDEQAISTVGDIKVVKQDNCLYFQHVGAAGVTRSDLIPLDTITYAKLTPAVKLAHKATVSYATLDAEVSATPVAGQTYVLGVTVRQYGSLGEEDTIYKNAEVAVVGTLTAEDFYKKMAIALAKNIKDGYEELLKVVVKTSDGYTEVDAKTALEDLDDVTAIGIGVKEAKQEWVRGLKTVEPIYFTLSCKPIAVSGFDGLVWGKIATETVADEIVITSGQKVADLEYFCMGERGDIYRNVGWPNVITTKYLVDETKDYDVIDIHFAFQGEGQSIQRSEKDITIVGENTVITALKEAINAKVADLIA